MYNLLKSKFSVKTLRAMLLSTQNAMLVSGGDSFWGQVDGVGENKLGKLLMRVRAEFVKENYDTINVFKREYLLEYGWARNTSGDDVFGECWAPPWNEECFFDLESAVHCQNKMSADILKTAHDMGLLEDDKRDTDIPDALNDSDVGDVCGYV
jgi:hypothetical protein